MAKKKPPAAQPCLIPGTPPRYGMSTPPRYGPRSPRRLGHGSRSRTPRRKVCSSPTGAESPEAAPTGQSAAPPAASESPPAAVVDPTDGMLRVIANVAVGPTVVVVEQASDGGVIDSDSGSEAAKPLEVEAEPQHQPHWSDDEKFAASGLSPKCFAHQIPDIWSLVKSLQECVQAFEDRPADVAERGPPLHTLVSRVYVVLRMIRGAAGIRWAAKFICKELLGDVASTRPTHAVLLRLGAVLLTDWQRRVKLSAGKLVQYVSSWELVIRWETGDPLNIS